jgi:ABC-type polar amino acid transport system ATPase subunit
MITVKNLVKFHGPSRVLDGVSLEVRQGEVTALVGPSGGGKSTLLRCINGLESFHDGEINVAGLTLAANESKPHGRDRLIALRRTVGMVFQQFNLFPHLTALANVMSGPLYALGRPQADVEEAARDLLNRVGLSDKLFAKPAQLSGGQQQRVAIARALAVNPRVILFDEPTSALDPKMADEVLAVMHDLARDGQTMIVVTHATEFAARATVVHRMEAGQIVKSGPPGEVL